MLYLEEENVIFSGDCLLGEGSSVFENLGDYLNSLRLMLKFNPTTIYPGHGKVIDDPTARINEHIKHRLDREQMILNQLKPDKPLSIAEIVDLIYTVIMLFVKQTLFQSNRLDVSLQVAIHSRKSINFRVLTCEIYIHI